MNEEDIKHLATLARLDLTDEEVKSYTKEFTDILGYVEQIKEVEMDDSGTIESAGVRNAFREDENPHESGKYTEDLVNSAPKSRDGYIETQKILNTNDNA